MATTKRWMTRLIALLVWVPIVLLAAIAPAAAVDISVSQWGSSLTGLPYVVALNKRLFQQAGIDVTGIIGSGGGGTTVRNVLASPLPYGEVAVDAVLAARQSGIDVIIVNTGTRQLPGSSIVARPDSGIRSLADLAGHKVAVTSPRSISEMVLLMGLDVEKVERDKVSRVTAGGYGQGLTMLDHGAVDAASLIEPLSLVEPGRYTTVVNLNRILPPMVITVGITTASYAKAHPDEIKALIAGRRAAVQAIYADPKAAGDILAGSVAYKLPSGVGAEVIGHYVAARTWSEGEFHQDEFDRMAEGLRSTGQIKGPIDWNAILDTSYLPADLRH